MKDLFLGFSQHSVDAPACPIYLPSNKRNKTHTLVIGSPGSGKSKFLEWLIRSDIQNHRGVCVLDIHGSLFQDIKRWCAHNHFLSRKVILLDPADGTYVQGFNPFQPKVGMAVDVQASGMVQALLRVWGSENTNETPTLDRVLRLLFSAMIIKRMPLHDAFHLINFTEKKIRDEVIESLTDPVVRGAWQQLQSLRKAGEWRGEVLSTENRLFRLVSSATIRSFMGSVDPARNLNTAEVMNNGHALLVNLKESHKLTDDNAKAIAALVINDLFKTAIVYRDRDTLGFEPRPFDLYIDEWQNIVTPDIKKILAQARKFGLLLRLANQDLSQIREAFSDEFVNTLLTCCQVKACFGGLNRQDAERMAGEMLVGQIDLNETKYEIESTKFWPKYTRDHTYTRTTSSTSGTSSTGEREPTENSSGSESESYADIPILIPEPFTEVTSLVTYSLEEQKHRWSDRLMEQYQRHCFIKIPGEKTIPLLVPVVKDYFVSASTARDYESELAQRNGARPQFDVDPVGTYSKETKTDATAAENDPDDDYS